MTDRKLEYLAEMSEVSDVAYYAMRQKLQDRELEALPLSTDPNEYVRAYIESGYIYLEINCGWTEPELHLWTGTEWTCV